MDGKSIGELISKKRATLNLTLEDVAEKTGTSRQNIKRYEDWNLKKPDYILLKDIFRVLGISESFLPSGGKQIINSPVVNDPEIGYSKQRSIYKSDHTLTYLPMSAMAGFLNVMKDLSPEIRQEFEQVKLPDYNHCDTVIEVDGDSMYPTFSSKDQVICKKKESMRFIETGKPYVINVDGEFVVKRIFDHEAAEKLILRSDNPYYPDQIIEREWVRDIFKIHGVISNNTGERKITKSEE